MNDYKQRRERAGLTQDDLAHRSHVSRSTIQSLEANPSNISDKTRMRVESVLSNYAPQRDESNYNRKIFCPGCGAKVEVPACLPDAYVLPDHHNGPGGNICQLFGVTVVFFRMACCVCKCPISKHPSGMCAKCYSEKMNDDAFVQDERNERP